MGELIDFTAWRLERLIKESKDPQWQEQVMGVLASYYEGDVAIAWEDGLPVVMPTQSADWHGWLGIPAGFTMTSYDAKELEEEVEDV